MRKYAKYFFKSEEFIFFKRKIPSPKPNNTITKEVRRKLKSSKIFFSNKKVTSKFKAIINSDVGIA